MSTNVWAAAGALLSLGALHGLNPGMGWLFAVALGVQQRERRAVWRALGPLLSKVHAAPSALTPEDSQRLRAQAAAFIAIHEQHLPLEDDVAFPATRSRMLPEQLRAMSDDMQRRRAPP